MGCKQSPGLSQLAIYSLLLGGAITDRMIEGILIAWRYQLAWDRNEGGVRTWLTEKTNQYGSLSSLTIQIRSRSSKQPQYQASQRWPNSTHRYLKRLQMELLLQVVGRRGREVDRSPSRDWSDLDIGFRTDNLHSPLKWSSLHSETKVAWDHVRSICCFLLVSLPASVTACLSKRLFL